MGDDELVNYILRARERGRSREQIIRALYSVGWKKEKVAAAFERLDSTRTWQQPQAPAPQPAPVQGQPIAKQPPTTQPQPVAKAPFSFPHLFGAKQPPVQQPVAQQPTVQQQAPMPQVQPAPAQPPQQQPEGQPVVQQAPPQQAQPHPLPQQPATQQVAQQAPPGYTPGVLPPSATFTISTQQVPVSTQQQATVSPKAQPQPGNQAFSNLTSAAAKEAAKHGISPLSIALIIIILILGTAYVLQSRSAQPPAIDGPHINVTQLQQQEKNVTKPPVVPQKPAQNAAKTPSKNQTAPLPTNKTQPKAPNNTVQQNQTPLQQFSRYSRFFSSEGTPPSQFCQGRDAALYRVHYFQYSGSDCITGTGQGSYSSPLDFPYACDAIPCCYNSVSKEYSRLYDQFECGFYS